MKNSGYVAVRRLDNEFLLIEKGSHNTESEQTGSSIGRSQSGPGILRCLESPGVGVTTSPDAVSQTLTGVFSLPLPRVPRSQPH